MDRHELPQPVEQFCVSSASGKAIQVSVFSGVFYESSFSAMVEIAQQRMPEDDDQIWLLQHAPVYTQGTACKLETFIPSDIPVVKTDRGGQITYHGPGQIVMYPLLHLKHFGLGVKALVTHLEQCVIDTLSDYQQAAVRRADAPGVYVDDAKIAALGLRIRRGNSYHGLSFNVDMDLTPFSNIDPCGYSGLRVTQLSDLVPASADITIDTVAKKLLSHFLTRL